ncbi:MAG: hypothetical protein QME81_05105 [bacterium]|nr:hypothetical protein [bacterium]
MGYGRYIIKDMFYGGLNFKFITHSLAGHSGYGFGVDLGLLSDISSVLKDKDDSILWIIHHLRMGMRASVNSDKSWDSGHSDPGFIEMKVGASFEPVLFYGGYKWIVALSIDNVRERPLTLSAGTELQILNIGIDSIAVRAGINNYYLEQRDTLISKEDLNKGASYYSLGFGGRRGFLGFDLSTSFERLGTKHRLSFNVGF